MSQMPVLSLFSGVGGLDLGFEDAGFRPLLAIDNSNAAVDSYNLNRAQQGQPARLADLARENVDTIIDWWEERAGEHMRPTGIIGGPPCQAFSIANVHKSLDDPRATLPFDFARIAKVFNARFNLDFFVFENVVGLARKPHHDKMEAVIYCLEDAGFEVRRFVLDAADFGVPQFRRRLFFVGFNRHRYDAAKYDPPDGTKDRVTVRQAIGGLPEPIFFSRHAHPEDKGLHPNHWCMNPRSPKFRSGKLQSGEMKGRSFRRLAWDAPSWTASYGHREVHVHPDGKRRLSVYEAMLIQGFPSCYRLQGTLSQQIQLVSDAVPPPLAEALASTVKDFILSGGHPQVDEIQLSRNGHSEQIGLKGLQTVAPRSTRP